MGLILFDIDLTLILTSGVGRKALDGAMREMHGVEGAFEAVHFAGRTDRSISSEGLARSGLDDSEASILALRAAYIENLARDLATPGCPIARLPGALELLERLRGDGRAMALVTGNWREGAWLKLARCGLDRFFRAGAFAEDGASRNELPPVAVERAARAFGRGFRHEDCWMVGDTPDDIECGRTWGMATLGVATGPFGAEALLAAGADEILGGLSDTEEALLILGGDPR